MGFTLAVVLAAVLAALPAGTRGMNVFSALGLAGASALTAWLSRRLLLRPRDVHERWIGMTIALMLLSSSLRATYLLTWDGPFESHLMYMPPLLVTPFTLLYGVLPVVFAMLLHNVINARLLARLHQRAMTDHLTGSLSRHALAEGALALMARIREGGGDSVLRHAVALLQAELRGEALLARYGGEEFVVLAPVSDLPAARRVAERLRQSLEQAPWPDVVPGLALVTASLGVTLLAAEEALEHALARADAALYRAKHGGRNQVQVGLAAA
jgi:GGDEF domain-containing protein